MEFVECDMVLLQKQRLMRGVRAVRPGAPSGRNRWQDHLFGSECQSSLRNSGQAWEFSLGAFQQFPTDKHSIGRPIFGVNGLREKKCAL